MNRISKWWIVGGFAATLIVVACVGILAVGMMFAGPRFGGLMMNRQPGQPPAQVAPLPDDAPRVQPGQPDPRGFRGDDRGFYRDPMQGYGGRSYQGRGMGMFGFIGGIFRLFFTIVLIALALMFLRRFFFGRGRGWSWGGPGRWGGPGGPGAHGDVPPWAEEWHRKMHAKMDAPVAETPAEPASSAGTPAVTDAPQATRPDAPADGDTKLV